MFIVGGELKKHSELHNAGLREGAQITAIDGAPVESLSQFQTQWAQAFKDKKMSMKVTWLNNGKEFSKSVYVITANEFDCEPVYIPLDNTVPQVSDESAETTNQTDEIAQLKQAMAQQRSEFNQQKQRQIYIIAGVAVALIIGGFFIYENATRPTGGSYNYGDTARDASSFYKKSQGGN